VIAGTAVVFAAYPVDLAAFDLCVMYLDTIRENFPDADVFVGINPAGRGGHVGALREHAESLGMKVSITPPRLVLDSDASAFQSALFAMRQTVKEYNLIWFGHSKGATTKTFGAAHDQMNNFFGRREQIEAHFTGRPGIGVYGREVAILPNPIDVISPYKTRKFAPQPFMILNTFFVCLGRPVLHFMRSCNPSFFYDPLPDRYFFERDFYQLVLQEGYQLSPGKMVQLDGSPWNQACSDNASFLAWMANWIAENKIAIEREF
jgi:hypothetical protein